MNIVRRPGAGDCYGYWQPYLKEWGVNLSREEFYDYWFSAEQEIPELIEYARRLKAQGLKLFILSNNFAERTKYYQENFPFLGELFDGAYFSWQTGLVKSEIAAYQKLLDDNNQKGEECLYFDDSTENVELARELGIKAYQYQGLDNVREIVEADRLTREHDGVTRTT